MPVEVVLMVGMVTSWAGSWDAVGPNDSVLALEESTGSVFTTNLGSGGRNVLCQGGVS